MKPAPTPSDEAQRLAALRRYEVLDTPPESEFDDFTRLASLICGTPIALISLVDAGRQWFKSKLGIDAPETPRDISFCGHAVTGREVFEVPDAAEDERFLDNPLVAGEPHIRFYAGAPLISPDGQAIGTLCVIDRTPRRLSAAQRDALSALGRQVVRQMELRLAARRRRHLEASLSRKAAFQEALLDYSAAAIISTTVDGVITSFNARAEQLLGYAESELVDKETPGIFHDEVEVRARAQELTRELGRQIAPGFEVFVARVYSEEAETREWTYVRKDGSRVPVLLTVTGMRDDAGRLTGFIGLARELAEPASAPASASRLSSEPMRRRARWRPEVAIGGLGLLGAVFVLLSVVYADRAESYYRAVTNAIDGAGVAMSEAHLWLEEALHGDVNVRLDTQVFGKVDAAASLARLLRDGGAVAGGSIEAETNPAVRGRLDALESGIEQWRALALRRLEDAHAGRSGSPLDESFDALYARLMRSWVEQKAHYVKRFASIRHHLQWVNGALVVVLLCTAALSVGIMRRSRTDAERQRRELDRVVSERTAGLTEALASRREIEAELRRSEARIRELFEGTSDLVVSFTPDGRIVLVNRAWRETLGYDETGLTSLDVFDVVHPQSRERAGEALERLLAGEDPGSVQIELVAKDGRRITVDGRLNVAFDKGAPVACRGIFRDITETKAAADHLRESAARIQAVLDSVFDGVLSLDERGTVESFNPAAERIFGYAADEIVGRPIELLIPGFAARGDDEERVHGELARVAGMLDACEVDGRCRDGTLIPVELSVAEMHLAERRYFTSVVRDVAERKLAERAIVAAKDEAQRATEAKSAFLATMSHEIRTPLNGVIGMVDVLHQTSLRGDQSEMVVLIRESAHSLLAIINDILDFSKIEAGRLELEHAPMRVADVVEKACGLLDYHAASKDVDLTLFTDPALPETVLGDALRLRQVLVNLASNAIKFSSTEGRRGRVSVRAVVVERSSDRVAVEICVTDNGIGMDESTQSRLFTPFSQGDHSTTRRFGGTGLGLAISRHLTDLMGGTIAVRSAPGEGSTFTVRLALAPLAESVEEGPAAELAGLGCVLVGDSELTADLAAYLAAAGALVERAPTLPLSGASEQCCWGASTVIVVDAEGAGLGPESLQLALTEQGVSAPCVIIGRGRRRQPRKQEPGRIEVAANGLTRRALIRAVGVAAGRVAASAPEPDARSTSAVLSPPSREEALRQGRLLLVAEDSEINQDVISRQLALLGFAADIACDGREALERWRSGDYALLLSDVNMPRLDGYQLARRVRAEEGDGTHIPIIALTANALKGEAERCRAAGMDDYLSKPTPMAELRAALERWLPAACAVPEPAVASASPAPDEERVPMDVTVLEGLVGSEPSVVADFLRRFRASATGIAEELRTAVGAGEAPAAGAAAHKLKSSARSVGALRLAELCARIEDASEHAPNGELTQLLPDFEVEVAAVNRYLDTLPAGREALGRV